MIFKKFVFDIEKFSYGIYLIQGLFLCIYTQIVLYYEFYSNFLAILILIIISSSIYLKKYHILIKL